MPMAVQIGCGFRIKEIKGHAYVYFWRYEERGGRSRQVHVYVGPRRSPATGRRLYALLEAYYAHAARELERQRAAHRQEAAGLR